MIPVSGCWLPLTTLPPRALPQASCVFQALCPELLVPVRSLRLFGRQGWEEQGFQGECELGLEHLSVSWPILF